MQEELQRDVWKREGTLRGGDVSEDPRERKDERIGGMERGRKTTTDARSGKPQTRRILSPNKKSVSVSPFHATRQMLTFPSTPVQEARALRFPSVFDKGDHGGWSSVDPGATGSFDEGMLPVGNTTLGSPQSASC